MRWLIFSAALVLSVLGIGYLRAAGDDVPQGSSGNRQQPASRRLSETELAAKEGRIITVSELQKAYPEISLRNRLKSQTHATAERTAEPQLGPEAKKKLGWMELYLDRAVKDSDRRTKLLEHVHSEEAEDFFEREGFGWTRRPQPRDLQMYIRLPEFARRPLPLGTDQIVIGERYTPGVRLDPVIKDGTGISPAAQRKLAALHSDGKINFVKAEGWGSMKDLDHVTGFAPHGVRMFVKPDDRPGVKTEPWLITRLELVSLLLHPDPVVYISDDVPRMEELTKADTRKLSAFEQHGLEPLRRGEDVFIDDSSEDSILMLGALRATKQCAQCHDAPRGEMLGAFSYVLKRQDDKQTPHSTN